MSEKTLDEMVKELNDYCEPILYEYGSVNCCKHCKMVDEDGKCDYYDEDSSPDEIKRNYDKIKEETVSTEETVDMINNPPHYTHGGMETIDEMELIFGVSAVMYFCLCNAWKYRSRALYKNGEEDMKKSDWYLNKYKELMESYGRCE